MGTGPQGTADEAEHYVDRAGSYGRPRRRAIYRDLSSSATRPLRFVTSQEAPMSARHDTLTEAIFDLARRGERHQLYQLATALAQAARLCTEIANAAEPSVEAQSALVLSAAFARHS